MDLKNSILRIHNKLLLRNMRIVIVIRIYKHYRLNVLCMEMTVIPVDAILYIEGQVK